MRRLATPVLAGARAAILHRPHPTVEALTRQLAAIGLAAEAHWPDLAPSVLAADFVFFDVDRGHDAQFPWKPGEAPMPMVALIGSEAPGRIEWALSMGADAQLLKPVGDGGVYSALLIAHSAFVARRALAAEVEGLRARLAERRTVLRAVLLLAGGQGEEAGYAALRRRAMEWRVTIEEAAARILAARGPARGGRHDRHRPA
ncbi:ANTAR domain-containing response regulator [Rubellimicrobium sp. CFH 75288]|uniref:ANTAR domain-containing response regulator n=1 Tax=Rubellimicrobium sp. CFH 75288 TaxID=2697034 RepID=UPI001411FF11|nr:ANTAR domain-containing protein [Rubellimicrobium sp. CFH 75288]NAZ35671.1 transcriptional antiterminator [Rubellimicrobium sp. CFH 75288]